MARILFKTERDSTCLLEILGGTIMEVFPSRIDSSDPEKAPGPYQLIFMRHVLEGQWQVTFISKGWSRLVSLFPRVDRVQRPLTQAPNKPTVLKSMAQFIFISFHGKTVNTSSGEQLVSGNKTRGTKSMGVRK